MSEHKCEGMVWCHTKYLPCGKTARYEHEGRWCCKRHHPPTVQAKLDARNKKFEEDWKSRLQAAKEANEARAEMQRKAAAYDGLIAQRGALLRALIRCRDRFFPANQPERDRDELWEPVNAAIKAVEETK